MDKNLKRTIVMLVSILALAFTSLVLNVLKINFGMFPEFSGLQFSAIPEALTAVAFGPFVALGVVVVKAFFYFWLTGCAFAELVGYVIIDAVFVVALGVIYYSLKRSKTYYDEDGKKHKKRIRRRTRILIAGLISTVVATLIAYVVMAYLGLPMIVETTETTLEELISQYASTIPLVNSKMSAAMFAETPIAFVEYLVATIVSAFIYKPLSPFFHGKFVR